MPRTVIGSSAERRDSSFRFVVDMQLHESFLTRAIGDLGFWSPIKCLASQTLRVITPNSLTIWNPMKYLVSQTAAKAIENERLFGKHVKHLPP